MVEIVAYTDGACSGNPGPGGWGVLLQAKKDGKVVKEKTLYGGEKQTTNNRMELTAAIEALNALEKSSNICIRTDSRYLCDGISKWMEGWKKNRWRGGNNNLVKNVDLWKRLDELSLKHDVTWQWVKGHANEPGNEKADKLASKGLAPYKT